MGLKEKSFFTLSVYCFRYSYKCLQNLNSKSVSSGSRDWKVRGWLLLLTAEGPRGCQEYLSEATGRGCKEEQAVLCEP